MLKNRRRQREDKVTDNAERSRAPLCTTTTTRRHDCHHTETSPTTLAAIVAKTADINTISKQHAPYSAHLQSIHGPPEETGLIISRGANHCAPARTHRVLFVRSLNCSHIYD